MEKYKIGELKTGQIIDLEADYVKCYGKLINGYRKVKIDVDSVENSYSILVDKNNKIILVSFCNGHKVEDFKPGTRINLKAEYVKDYLKLSNGNKIVSLHLDDVEGLYDVFVDKNNCIIDLYEWQNNTKDL